MSDAVLPYLGALVSRLKGRTWTTSGMAAAKVVNEPPQGLKTPYVVVSAPTAFNADVQGLRGHELACQITPWSRHRGDRECLQIAAEIYEELHDAQLIVTGQNPVQIYFESSIGPFVDEYDERLRQMPLTYNALSYAAE